MSQRFFSNTPLDGSQVMLAGPDAHHLTHVMRARVGQEVRLFDGTGREAVGRVASIARTSVTLSVEACRTVDRELPVAVTVGVSLPKGDRQRWLVEKLVELGARSVVPLITTHGVAQPTATAIERLRRTVIEAAKQCGRNRLMEVEPPRSWTQFVAESPRDARRLVAHPGADLSLDAGIRQPESRGFVLGVGPEGGLSDDEARTAIEAGWTAVDLGSRILRVETAAVMMLAAVAARHGA